MAPDFSAFPLFQPAATKPQSMRAKQTDFEFVVDTDTASVWV